MSIVAWTVSIMTQNRFVALFQIEKLSYGLRAVDPEHFRVLFLQQSWDLGCDPGLMAPEMREPSKFLSGFRMYLIR